MFNKLITRRSYNYRILINTCPSNRESLAFTYKAYINGNYLLSYGVLIPNYGISSALAVLRRILLNIPISKDLVENMNYYIWYNGVKLSSSSSVKKYIRMVKRVGDVILSSPYSDKGPNKEVNEDSTGFLTVKHCSGIRQKLVHIFAIADGVSSLQRGDYASSFAVKSFMLKVSSLIVNNLNLDLKETIMDMHDELLNSLRGSNMNTGTTFTGGVITYMGEVPRVTIAHIGDTRAYRIMGGKVEKLTRDHSLGGHAITQALGYIVNNVDIVTATLERDSYLVLTTDGVTDVLTDEHIGYITYSNRYPTNISVGLVHTARTYGSTDDASALTIWYV